MEFLLGNLGINIKLLVAQIINFGVLLWLLARFVYKPIIERIEKDEKQLSRAQEQEKSLQMERELFSQKMAKETKAAKERMRKIISEAERMAETTESRTHDRAEKEARELVVQTKAKLRNYELSFKKEILYNIVSELTKKVPSSFRESISRSTRKKLQGEVFFYDFIRRVKSLPLDNMGKTGLAEELEKLSLQVKNKVITQKKFREEAKKAFIQRIGPVVLEYAIAVDKKQEEEIKRVVYKKIENLIGRNAELVCSLEKKQNKSLISGFRLEIAGNLIEANLFNILSESLKHAIESKQ